MRQKYLIQDWKPYPQTFAQAKAQGRFLEFRGAELLLWVQGEVRVYSGLDLQLEQCQEHPSRILLEGDVVCLNEEAKVLRLLAPNNSIWKRPPVDGQELQRWSDFLEKTKIFFKAQNFLEIQTPSLVVCPGSEPTLDVFEVSSPKQKQKLFLPTSPEWHLKKALAYGYEKIFEMRPCFRAGETSERHRPEFWMCEWYRSYNDLTAIEQDVLSLIQFLAEEFKISLPRAVHFKSVAQLFREFLNFELRPETTESQLRELGQQVGVDLASAESIDDCFFLIFMEKIESQWPAEDLVFVKDYPPYQAALARLTADGWGERFEVYWQGLELANAFHELNDPQMQRQRFQEDMDKKKLAGREVLPADEDFFAALDMGMPPSAGIALGLERLYMALFGIKQIQKLKVF